MFSAEGLIDHEEIRAWTGERGARPARMKNGADQSGGVLRFDFGEQEEGLEPVSWDQFFRIFADPRLVLLEQEETASAGTSRFSRFVRR